MVELSMIIPTYNEELFLPKLLDSIKKQKYKNYEVIVADNNSKDKTREIAKQYKCKIVEGGLPGKARNNAAKIAKGKYFLFIDADSIIPEDCLDKAIKQFKEKKLDIAIIKIVPDSKYWLDIVLHSLYNLLVWIFYKLDPYISFAFYLCSKRIYKKVGGFDETIKIAEDHAFARAAYSKDAKIGYLNGIYVTLSVRRFELEGRFTLAFKYFLILTYRSFLGEIRRRLFSYKWGLYKKIKSKIHAPTGI